MLDHSRPRLDALTSLRFFAALHVLIFHLRTTGAVSAGPVWYQKLASVGYLGVSFFFVLSGFILVYTYAGAPLSKRDFWQARFARIYPAYAVALLVAFPFFFWVMTHIQLDFVQWWKQHLSATCLLVATLMQGWVPQTTMAWNPVAWSLSVEAFFYLLFPFLLVACSKLQRKGLLALFGVAWSLSLIATLGYGALRPDGIAHGSNADEGLFWLTTIKFNPLVRLPEFMLGMAAGLLFVRGRAGQRLGTGLVLGGMTAFAVVVALSNRIPFPVLHSGLVAPAFAAMIFGVAARPRWARVLAWRRLVLLGDASYSLYLLHFVIIWGALVNFGRAATAPAGIALLVLACLAAAVVSYKLVEEPTRRRLRPTQPSSADTSGADHVWGHAEQAVAAGK